MYVRIRTHKDLIAKSSTGNKIQFLRVTASLRRIVVRIVKTTLLPYVDYSINFPTLIG